MYGFYPILGANNPTKSKIAILSDRQRGHWPLTCEIANICRCQCAEWRPEAAAQKGSVNGREGRATPESNQSIGIQMGFKCGNRKKSKHRSKKCRLMQRKI